MDGFSRNELIGPEEGGGGNTAAHTHTLKQIWLDRALGISSFRGKVTDRPRPGCLSTESKFRKIPPIQNSPMDFTSLLHRSQSPVDLKILPSLHHSDVVCVQTLDSDFSWLECFQLYSSVLTSKATTWGFGFGHISGQKSFP